MNDLNVKPSPRPDPIKSKLPDPENSHVAQQIIDAFAAKAQRFGIRSIVMSEIAKELRISTKTLYKYFRTKEDLVYELIVRWENRTHRPISSYGVSLLEVLRYWVKVWVENDAQFSTAFWRDLKTDHPRLYQVYIDSLYIQMSAMQRRLTPYLRDDINHDFAWSTYFILMTASAQSKNFEKISITREQSVYAAFDFWIHGALDLEKLKKAKLELPNTKP